MLEFFEELWDEASDFFEDFWEHLLKRRAKEPKKTKTLVIDGTLTNVRPAYLFAERIDNLLRFVFGVSIIVSALTATFLGFSSLSELLSFLISTVVGRVIMLLIGLSYLVIGVWKLIHLAAKN
jgi:hypothetical protein